jgi:predicted ATP-grasp superfamily ATP-dependent carboligase
MTDISKRLFDHLRWHGIAEVEYVTHEETGEYYLIEVNPRIWGGVNSAISSGLDIGDIMARIATGRRVEPVHYRRGVITRWFWGDLRVLPDYYRSRGRELSSVWEYVKLMFDGTKTDEFYWDDPIPFFVWPAHALYKMIRSRSITPAAYDSLSGEWE